MRKVALSWRQEELDRGVGFGRWCEDEDGDEDEALNLEGKDTGHRCAQTHPEP